MFRFAAAAALSFVAMTCAGIAHAAVVLSPNSPAPGQHTITLDTATFTITAAGNVNVIVFEDFFAANATVCGFGAGSTLTASINGGAAFAISQVACTGVFATPYGAFDPNDLLIDFSVGFNVAIGDTVTIGGTAIFTASSLPALNPNFTQVAQLVDAVGCTGCVLSAPTALSAEVPEPGSLALVGLALAGAAGARRGGWRALQA